MPIQVFSSITDRWHQCFWRVRGNPIREDIPAWPSGSSGLQRQRVELETRVRSLVQARIFYLKLLVSLFADEILNLQNLRWLKLIFMQHVLTVLTKICSMSFNALHSTFYFLKFQGGGKQTILLDTYEAKICGASTKLYGELVQRNCVEIIKTVLT